MLRLKEFVGIVVLSVLEEREGLNLNRRDTDSKVYSFVLFFKNDD